MDKVQSAEKFLKEMEDVSHNMIKTRTKYAEGSIEFVKDLPRVLAFVGETEESWGVVDDGEDSVKLMYGALFHGLAASLLCCDPDIMVQAITIWEKSNVTKLPALIAAISRNSDKYKKAAALKGKKEDMKFYKLFRELDEDFKPFLKEYHAGLKETEK